MKTSSLILLLLFTGIQSFGQGWSFFQVNSQGDHPALALDNAGNPCLSYEVVGVADSHVINYSVWDSVTETFTTEEADRSGFQGHTDIVFDLNNVPHICYHSHFWGDLVHSYKNGTVWINEPLGSLRHDGFSGSIAIDSRNLVHASYVNHPFDSLGTGIEYGLRDGESWSTEPIGSEPDLYWFYGTSIDLDALDNPYITYYDDIAQDLMLGTKASGTWTISTIDSAGDVGRFSSMEIDSNGSVRVAYLRYLSDTSGIIKLAQFDRGSWVIFNIDTLDSFDFALVPEDIVSLDIDKEGNSHIGYADTKVLIHAKLAGETITKEVVVDLNGTNNRLDQSASLAIDASGGVHIGYFGPFATDPFAVMYAVKNEVAIGLGNEIANDPTDEVASPIVSDIPDQNVYPGERFAPFALDGYVSDPDDLDSEITWRFSGNVSLIVLCEAVRRGVIVQSPRNWTGSETIRFTATDPDGNSSSDNATFTVNDTSFAMMRGAGHENARALSTVLEMNYPNPFNPTTMIPYQLAEDSWVTLKVYNDVGQEVITLVDEYQSAGYRSAVWDGRNSEGQSVASGVYVYRMAAGSFVKTQKMMFVR